MTKPYFALMTFFGLFFADSVQGSPRAYYNPLTGNVTFANDLPYAIPAASLLSQTGSLTSASNMESIPGAIKDDTEFPWAYSYLFLPPGLHDTGNTVTVGTSITDLEFEYYYDLGPSQQGAVIEIPEPSSLVLTSLFLLGARRLRQKHARFNESAR